MSMASSTGVMIGTFLLQRVVATAALYVTIAAIYIGRTFMVFSPFSGVSRGRVIGSREGIFWIPEITMRTIFVYVENTSALGC